MANEPTPAQRLPGMHGAPIQAPLPPGVVPNQGTPTETRPTGPSPADLQAQLTAANTAKVEAEARYNNLRTAFGRQGQEIGVLRRQQNSGYEQVDENGYIVENSGTGEAVQTPQGYDEGALNNMQRMDFIDFRMDHPDWQDHWDEMMKVCEHPMESRKVIAFRRETPGAPDYYVTYHNAYLQVQNKKFREAEAKRGEAQANLEQGRNDVNRLGTSTGSTEAGNAGDQGPIDLSKLQTSQDIAEAFPTLINQNDPPSFMRRR